MSRQAIGVAGQRPDMQFIHNTHTIPSLTAGGNSTDDLPKGMTIKRVYLDLRVDLTAAGGGGTVIEDNPATLLRSIVISGTRRGGGGRVTFVSASGPLLYWSAAFKHGRKPYRIQLGGGGNQVNTILRCVIPVDFYASDMSDQGRGLLYTSLFEDLRVDLTWGVPTDLISAGTTINAATCDIIVHQIQGIEPSPDEPIYVNVHSSAVFPVVASSAAGTPLKMFNIGPSGEIKSLLFRTSNTTTVGRPLVNTIVTGDLVVKLDNHFVSRQLSWERLRALCAWIPGPGVHPIMTDAAGVRAVALGTEMQPPNGYCFVDFAPNGGEDGLIQASGLDSFMVLADLTTNGNGPQVEMLINRFDPMRM